MLTMSTDLCDLLKIKYPIIQAGMAGGATTPALVASVSNAGGLGTLGAAYMKPEDIKMAIAEIRKLTDQPFAVNLFCVEHSIEPKQNEKEAVKQELLNIGRDLSIVRHSIKCSRLF